MEKEYEINKQREKFEKEVEEVKGIRNVNHSAMKSIIKLINSEQFNSIGIYYIKFIRRKRLLKQIKWQRFVTECQERSFARGDLLDGSNDSEYQYVFGEIAHNMYNDIYGIFEWAH